MTEPDFNASTTGPVTRLSEDAVANVPQAPTRAAIRSEGGRTPLRELEQAPEGLERVRKAQEDKFYVPQGVINQFKAAGWGIEWKRHSTLGQEDPSYQVALAENHWQAVTTDEIPGFMPLGYSGAVIRDGLQLMKRPLYLIEEARMEDQRAAKAAVQGNIERLSDTPSGTMSRTENPKTAPKVSREYGSMQVPNNI